MTAENFKKLFLPFHRNFYQLAYRMLENTDDAEDVVQDVYVKLWMMRTSLGNIRNPEAFGITITRNICIDRLRSLEYKTIKSDSSETLKNEITDIADKIDMLSEIKKIKKIVATLPDNQRKIFIFRYFKDCTIDEIKKITGFGSGNIRVMLNRARNNIKELYEKR